jgi:polyisoprenoid-binding protein YceI
MRLALMSFAAVALVAGGVLAQTAAAPPAMPAGPDRAIGAQPAGVYVVDPGHTSVVWSVGYQGLSQYTARFDKVNAQITLDPKDPTKSSVNATIDAMSVSTGCKGDVRNYTSFDEKVAVEAFDAKTHPTITFKSTGIRTTGANTGVITGDLTLAGVTRPVSMNATFNGGMFNRFAQKQALGFTATTTIKRSEWGVTDWIPIVGDDTTITINAILLKQ